jgi:hypothetical protein
MKTRITYVFNVSDPDDLEQMKIIQNAETLERCYRDFYNTLRSMKKHSDFTGVDPNDLILDVWEKFLKDFEDYNVRTE